MGRSTGRATRTSSTSWPGPTTSRTGCSGRSRSLLRNGGVARRGARVGSERDRPEQPVRLVVGPDRKSTRLNSRHRCISYAVFCLKKKKKGRKDKTGAKQKARSTNPVSITCKSRKQNSMCSKQILGAGL